MDCIDHGVPKSWTPLSEFHYTKKNYVVYLRIIFNWASRVFSSNSVVRKLCESWARLLLDGLWFSQTKCLQVKLWGLPVTGRTKNFHLLQLNPCFREEATSAVGKTVPESSGWVTVLVNRKPLGPGTTAAQRLQPWEAASRRTCPLPPLCSVQEGNFPRAPASPQMAAALLRSPHASPPGGLGWSRRP